MKLSAPLWTPSQDELLMDMMAEGKSFAKAGAAIGRTTGACVSRFKRLCELMGAQAT